MNWQKVDPSLASAVGSAEDLDTPQFKIFVITVSGVGPSECAYLDKLGVRAPEKKLNSRLFTAKVSARAIGGLSEQSWVRSLKLSQDLQLATER